MSNCDLEPNDENCIIKSKDVLEGVFRNVPHESGCYAFFSKSGECLYVGESTDVYHRVRFGHRFTNHYIEAEKLYFWIADNRKELEKQLISFLNPKYNKRRN